MAPPTRTFKHLLLWLFTGTRGGANRGRIIEAIRDQPMNTNQLRILLDLDYRTVKHHLDVLEDNDIITSAGNSYGKMYFVSEKLSPTQLNQDSASAILGTSGFGGGFREFGRTLTTGEALANNWVSIAALTVVTVAAFAASYMMFLRTEIRPGE